MIKIRQSCIEEVVEVNNTIAEFGKPCDKEYFESRYKDKDKLIIVAFVDNKPAGYLIGYDRYNDDSFYCWMTGVNPNFRRKGVLTVLMDYMNKWAAGKGYKKIKIKTRNNKRAMLAYLVKYDYLFTGVDEREDIMENRIMLEKKI